MTRRPGTRLLERKAEDRERRAFYRDHIDPLRRLIVEQCLPQLEQANAQGPLPASAHWRVHPDCVAVLLAVWGPLARGSETGFMQTVSLFLGLPVVEDSEIHGLRVALSLRPVLKVEETR